jgi:hypothetical protein
LLLASSTERLHLLAQQQPGSATCPCSRPTTSPPRRRGIGLTWNHRPPRRPLLHPFLFRRHPGHRMPQPPKSRSTQPKGRPSRSCSLPTGRSASLRPKTPSRSDAKELVNSRDVSGSLAPTYAGSIRATGVTATLVHRSPQRRVSVVLRRDYRAPPILSPKRSNRRISNRHQSLQSRSLNCLHPPSHEGALSHIQDVHQLVLAHATR